MRRDFLLAAPKILMYNPTNSLSEFLGGYQRMKTLFVVPLLCISATLALGQVGHIDGTVTDQSGAAVPAAEVTVTENDTHVQAKAATSEKGQWTVAQLEGGTYTVTITKPGFKVATVGNVMLSAGSGVVVSTKLEVGQATETVTVSGGAEIVQATSAEITNELTGRQVTELPFATRNAVELMVTQPGTATPTDPRSSTINGLPKGAINITLDGINTQDNYLKSSDGYFSYIMPSVDSLEEVTMTTSAAGADSTAQGAAQIKFVTKSGTNQYHGGAFYQARNTFFNSNYYFNNEDWSNAITHTGLPRAVLHLRQYGGHFGGPILKDKLFFFANIEDFRNPSSESVSTTIINPQYYQQGLYNYQTTTGAIATANLYNIAGSGNSSLPAGTRPFATTIDPIVSSIYNEVAGIAPAFNSLSPNTGAGDYNSGIWNFQVPADDERNFYTGRGDYNITAKHHLSITYDYDHYFGKWDLLNGVYAVYPNQGVVLGSNSTSGLTGQFSKRFVGSISAFGHHGTADERTHHGSGRRNGNFRIDFAQPVRSLLRVSLLLERRDPGSRYQPVFAQCPSQAVQRPRILGEGRAPDSGRRRMDQDQFLAGDFQHRRVSKHLFRRGHRRPSQHRNGPVQHHFEFSGRFFQPDQFHDYGLHPAHRPDSSISADSGAERANAPILLRHPRHRPRSGSLVWRLCVG